MNSLKKELRSMEDRTASIKVMMKPQMRKQKVMMFGFRSQSNNMLESQHPNDISGVITEDTTSSFNQRKDSIGSNLGHRRVSSNLKLQEVKEAIGNVNLETDQTSEKETMTLKKVVKRTPQLKYTLLQGTARNSCNRTVTAYIEKWKKSEPK